MSRLTIDLAVQTATPAGAVNVVPGATAQVFVRNSDGTAGALTPVYRNATTTDNTQLTQPLAVSSQGAIPGWLNPGDYVVQVGGTGFGTQNLAYTVPPTLNGAGGAAQLGTDGKVGGPGGSALSGWVVSASSAAAGQRPVAVGDGTAIFANPQFIDPTQQPYNAKFDLRTSAQGSMSSISSPTQLTLGDYTFTTADIGKKVKVVGAAAAGANLLTTISGVSSGAAVLAAACATTVSAAAVIFGTDDTAALNACFSDLNTAGYPRKLARAAMLPQGAALFTQLVLPRFGMVTGAGMVWGGDGAIGGFYPNWETIGMTFLYQMWGSNKDAIRFHDEGGFAGEYGGAIGGFLVQQDSDNTSGKGVSFRDVSGTALWIIDGGKIRDISARGFASAGWEIPAGATPATFERIHASANGLVDGSAGVVYATGGHDNCATFQMLSGDQNAGGLIHLTGDGAGTHATITFIGLKSEFAVNNYRAPAGAPQQSTAIVVDNMVGQGASIAVVGLSHHADGNSAGTTLGPAIHVLSTGASPEITWEGVEVQVQAPQTNSTAYVLTDDNGGQLVPVDKPGRGSHGSGGLVRHGGRVYDLTGETSVFQGGGLWGDVLGRQLSSASKFVDSYYAQGAPAGQKLIGWLIDPADGSMKLIGVKSDNSLDDTAVTVTRLAPGITVGIPKLIVPDWSLVKNQQAQLNALAANTYGISSNGTGVFSGSAGGQSVFWLDPADWGNGRTAQLRLRVTITANATASTVNFTFGLYPISASAGGGAGAVSVTPGAVVSGSTVAFTTPAANSGPTALDSGAFTAPAAGAYALGVVISGAMAVSSALAATCQLEHRAQ